MAKKLLVLWKKPSQPLSDGAIVLSFLSPDNEEQIAATEGVRLIRGRAIVAAVKPSALELYHELVAQIGATTLPGGLTLRQRLARPGCASLWWYHQLAVRDSESHPLFGWIVQTLAVQSVLISESAEELILVGTPHGIADILRGLCTVISEEEAPSTISWKSITLGLGSRLRYLCRQLRYCWFIRRRMPQHRRSFDLVLSSFWDWGIKWDQKSNGYVDRYFKRLPQLFMAEPGMSLGYFAWFDPYYETDQQGRQLGRIFDPLTGRTDVMLLQGYLTYWNIIRAVLDFGPLRVCWIARQVIAKKQILWAHGLDWLPLFGPVLLHSCLGAQIPNCELVSLATEAAARRHQPRLTLSFLEHFPHARAHYDGMKRAGIGAPNWAMQHAGVCHEKTFYYLHPRLEFSGETDGCRVPTPDKVFAMGQLAFNIFTECGYRAEQVVLTGSARYDHIRLPVADQPPLRKPDSSKLHILLACTLEVGTEIEMVEAVCLAACGLQGLTLRLRNHPSKRVDAHPNFAAYRTSMEVSSGSLEADLCWADLVMYSYSTVAEEAFLSGLPAWQWLPVKFNGSALAEAMKVPVFESAPQLREMLERFIAHPEVYQPTFRDRKIAAEWLFLPADGRAAERIVASCMEHLSRVAIGSRGL